ncbi:MAG: hypothetical protein M3471_00975 [Actinomycetota bacterium]|nr:hypothetical protein [Actinomycetota bacterium]
MAHDTPDGHRDDQQHPDPDRASDPPMGPTASSEARVAANRSNAQKSTGPRTAEGKRRSAANAWHHGFFAAAASPITSARLDEDGEDFHDFFNTLIDDLAPRDHLEVAQAQQVAAAYVRLARLERYETEQIQAAGHLTSHQIAEIGDEQRRRHDHLIFEATVDAVRGAPVPVDESSILWRPLSGGRLPTPTWSSRPRRGRR